MNIFICQSKGTTDNTVDEVVKATKAVADEVYVRDLYAPKEYLTVLGITHSGKSEDIDLNWDSFYTELAYVLVGVAHCDGVVFVGDWSRDDVCQKLFTLLAQDGFNKKNLWRFDDGKLVKVIG